MFIVFAFVLRLRWWMSYDGFFVDELVGGPSELLGLETIETFLSHYKSFFHLILLFQSMKDKMNHLHNYSQVSNSEYRLINSFSNNFFDVIRSFGSLVSIAMMNS